MFPSTNREESAMRLRKLASVLVAGASLIALAPASASAFKHPNPSGRCRININVAPRRIAAGDPIVIFGRLLCQRSANESNKVVKLFHHLATAPGFSYIQSTTTDSNGFYEFARADGVVVSNRAFYVRSHGAQSGRKAVKVAAEVSLSGPPEGTQILTGAPNKVTFTGTVSPADVGARVILQRQSAISGGDDWHRIDLGQVVAGGTFSITHTFRFPGDANIRVLVRSQRRNVPSPSNVLAYEISQSQNPALTIQASADPISYGQPVTISGTLVNGANQPVTLMARTDQQRFAPIAQVTTDASGNYSFPAQTPVNSTFYRVKTTGQVSAVLYEAVKDVLTAQVSQTTVQAGQAVTFSGTVAPDHTGHVIYLERQNAKDGDFHVVQIAIVGAGSTYTIEHHFYDPGTKTMRVHIPGGPENAGAASQVFTIGVTAAPASILMPEAPGNSTQPSEGQTEKTETEVAPAE
jgi:hypothetical protein